jgi:phage portal protein BeeE
MRVSAAYRCTALLAGATAIMPLPVYRQNDDGTREPARDHPVRYLLNEQPTPRFTAATFWEFRGRVGAASRRRLCCPGPQSGW